ncbi:MAG: hypothetical protein U0790_07505 [Isosphaeraceae bacterium]
MNHAPASTSPGTQSGAGGPDTARSFEVLSESLRVGGPEAAIRALVEQLEAAGEYRALLDALLLKARHELGLPPVQVGSLYDLPETVRTQFEERYVEAIRHVGTKLLAAGEIPAAWAYFRAIGEQEPVAAALDRYLPGDDHEKLAQVIDVSFNQGANPRRGFELILGHYGTCSAITALEQARIHDPAIQAACVERLVRHLHAQLLENLQADLRQRGTPATGASRSITELVAAHPELFAEEAYHTDVSHLSSTVRYSIMLTDRAALALAADLAEYGRRLSPRLQFEGAPPFERTFEDHLRYLRALLGQDVEQAVAHFRRKAEETLGDDLESTYPAQVLVNLLVRIGRLEDAIDVAGEQLAGLADGALVCPGVAELCQRAGRLDRLEAIARSHGNPVQFLAARLGTRPSAADAGA